MLSVVCFKWFDPAGRRNRFYVYGPEYVNRLRSMLARHLALPHRLVCVTDDTAGIDRRVEAVAMPDDIRGWPNLCQKIYAFHPDGPRLFGSPRLLMLDLDVVAVAALDPLFDRAEPFVAWAGPPHNKARYNTSAVLMDGGAFPEVWDGFDPDASVAALAAAGYVDQCDQDWVSHIVGGRGAVWPRSGGGIESFTPNRMRPLGDLISDGARLISFNGSASPGRADCAVIAPWIREHWI